MKQPDVCGGEGGEKEVRGGRRGGRPEDMHLTGKMCNGFQNTRKWRGKERKREGMT